MSSPLPPPRRMRQLWSWCVTEGGVACVMLLVAAALFVMAMQNSRGSAERQADATASRLAATLEQSIARNLELLDLTLRATVGGLEQPAVLGLDTETRGHLLFDRAPRDRYVSFIEALNDRGGVRAASPPAQYDENWSNRDYFIAARNGSSNEPFIGRPFATAREDTVAIPISRRLTDQNGNFAGVVVIGLRLAFFRDLFSRLELSPHDSAELVRDDGVVLMRQPFDVNNAGRTLDASAPFHAFMRDGATPVTAVDPIDRVERRTAFRRIGTLPLVVSVGLANDEIYGSWLSNLWLLLVVFGSLSVVLAVFAAWLARERRRRDAAERDSGEKSRFLTTLSHELRTPLHGVLGCADQLTRDGELSPAQSHQVAEIVRAGKHMRDVVNVVLDYARTEALGPALRMRQCDVRAVAEECLAIIEPSARARGLAAHIEAVAGTPTHFVTDDLQLRQILMNLLSNAVKYTPRGTVELRLMGDETKLVIEVADTGIGIPEGQRHRLFQEYERFDADRTSIEGTGLGLAIAHRLARRMGGHLGHRDNPAGGSIFWLELPPGVVTESDTVAEAREAAPEFRLNVLVVDDSEVNREVALAFLRKAGHTATGAHDGNEAVWLATAHDFDIILMDMRMAGLDGLEAARRIRALTGSRAQVPIVAVTANAFDEHAEECRLAGMADHLAKPFTQAELLAVVRRAAARRPRELANLVTTIDRDTVEELVSCMDPDALHGLFDCLELRIGTLLQRIAEPTPFAAPATLADLAHELAGGAGSLGFLRLSTITSQFQAAITTDPSGAERLVMELRREAEAVLAELCHRRALEGMMAP